MNSNLEKINQQFKKETSKPFISLKIRPAKTDICDSKFGGTPYLPPDFNYPQTSSGTPLRLLAQLNLSKLPHITGFPEKGILQFYIADNDLMGLDFDNPLSQDGFRIIYHENIDSPPEDLQTPLSFSDLEESFMPFDQEFQLSAKVNEMPLPTEDFRFSSKYTSIYNQHMNTDREDVWTLDEADDICEEFSFNGHRVGGYPFFTQNDPREFNDNLKDYSIMLLQIDSDYSDDNRDWEILWGDCGVANFFITPQQLKDRDFSKVLYNWDCC